MQLERQFSDTFVVSVNWPGACYFVEFLFLRSTYDVCTVAVSFFCNGIACGRR
jgi:hypothetical protein